MSNLHRHFYNLPTDYALSKGEYVRIYTGSGTFSQTPRIERATGKTKQINNIYWGMKACIWNNDAKDRATLIHYKVMDGKTVE